MHADILNQLKTLNCHGMASRWSEISADAAQLGAETVLKHLLEALPAQEHRHQRYHLR